MGLSAASVHPVTITGAVFRILFLSCDVGRRGGLYSAALLALVMLIAGCQSKPAALPPSPESNGVNDARSILQRHQSNDQSLTEILDRLEVETR